MGRLRSELNNNVAMYRGALGLSQEQLARATNVSRQTIVALEGGMYCPSTILALRLSILLGATVNELFMLPEPAVCELLQQRQHIEDTRASKHLDALF